MIAEEGYTQRVAHLATIECTKGQELQQNDVIGIMGNTGQSTGPHVHTDVIKGKRKKLWRLRQMFPGGPVEPDERQLNFCVQGIFAPHTERVTTEYDDPGYLAVRNKHHYAVDVVPKWLNECIGIPYVRYSRSWKGTVLTTGFDRIGYGLYVLIHFTPVEKRSFK